MRRPRVATVLTAQPWEAELVARARETGAVRIVGRGYRPEDVVRSDPDVAVVGFETAWLDDDVLGWWQLGGIDAVVVGSPASPAPDPSRDPDEILAEVRSRWLHRGRHADQAVTVVGARGAGVTEITCALAVLHAPCTVIDRDPPAVDLRLSGLADVAVVEHFPRDHSGPLVIDAGLDTHRTLGRCILVVEGTPLGFVRAANLIEEWTADVPDLVINKVREPDDATRRARHALGLEPAALIPYDVEIASASASGQTPGPVLLDPLERIIQEGGQPLR